jgi:release factor glutamine methyltransferase
VSTPAERARPARDVVDEVSRRLNRAGCESPRVDAELLLAHVLGTTRTALRTDLDRPLSDEDLAELEKLVARRERREPLAYVLGEWGFRRLTLKVDSRVLVPRPETEVVVERCLALINTLDEPRVLDVGTGSGAIALAIADEHPGARVTGIDASPESIEVATENARVTDLAVDLRQWDLFAGLPAGPWDLVVSNPPYVRPHEIDELEPEVRDWEPRAALVGEGSTEAVVRGARDVLRAGGALVLEVAESDAADVSRLLRERGYAEVTVTRDLAGRDRIVEGVTTSAD